VDISDSDFDSVSLFVDRAHWADPEFALDSVTAPIVADICRRLDGIPLAIELAAAQLSEASLQEVAERLDRRFASPPADRRSGPRHETLGATLDWSYESLTDAEQLLFGRLSAFSGGFTRDAVAEVCAAPPLERGSIGEVLDRLIATSLVVTTPDDPERYRLLVPIAQYARTRLAKGGGLDAIRPRHAAFYLSLAETADEQLRGPDQARWVQTLESERYNLRAALRWSRVHDSETSLRLAGALRWFWVIQRDVSEGSGWLRGALTDRGNASPDVVARALNGVGLLAFRALDTATARRAIEEARRYYEAAGDEVGLARQTYHLGIVAWFEDDPEAADEMLGEAQRLAEVSDDRWYLGWTLAIRGTIARTEDGFEMAGDYLRTSHEIFETAGGSIDRGWSSLRLGALARDLGDYAAAAHHYSDGRVLLAESGNGIGVAHADAALAAIDWLKGNRERALDVFGPVLEAFATSDEPANNLFELKMMIQGNPSASDLLQVAQWNKERAGFEADLGVKAGLAEYLYHLGKTGLRQGHLNRARAALLESLTLCREASDHRGAAVSLIGLGCVLAEQGQYRDAVMLYAKAAQVAEADQLDPWPPHNEPDFEIYVAASRAELDPHAFEQIWDESAGTSLDAVVGVVRKQAAG
jgi:tetratricopeptide (TPR) repeat protein